MSNTLTSTLPSFGNITISNSYGPSNSFGLDDLLNISNMHPSVKKYEMYETPADLLVLSSAWKRLRDEGFSMGKISSLLDQFLFDSLTEADYQLAKQIRDHYSKTILLWKLKGERMSKYREDLNSFIHSDGTKFREEMLGLAYHLPAFYEYDKQLDEIRLQVVSVAVPLQALSADYRLLKPLKRIVFKNKRRSNVEYWFQDSETSTAAVIAIETKNPLEHLWNTVFETSSILEISGKLLMKKRDNFEYVSITQWKIVEI